MKKVFSWILIFAVLLGLSACKQVNTQVSIPSDQATTQSITASTDSTQETISFPTTDLSAESAPIETTSAPTATTKNTGTTEATQATEQTASSKSTTATQPAATVKPTATLKPATTTKPVATAKPTATKKPTVTLKPTATKKPAATIKPTQSTSVSTEPTQEDGYIYDSNGLCYYECDGHLWVSISEACKQKNLIIPGKFNGKAVFGIENSASTASDYPEIESITISEGIAVIGGCALSDFANLKTVHLPSTLREIRMLAFDNSPIENITLPDGLEIIERGAFQKTQIERIVIPDSVTSIGTHAFKGAAIVEVTIPGSIALEASIFQECKQLKTVHLGEGITQIPQAAFQDCTALTTINLPESITHIGNKAFDGCTKLKFGHLVVNATLGSYVFRGQRIECLEMGSNPSGNSLADTNIGTLILREGVTSIGNYALTSTDIDTLVLPTTLKTVGSYAFYYSTIDTVVFQNAVALGANAFRSSSVKSVTLPEGSTLDLYVFVNCKNLETIRYGGTMAQWSRLISRPNYGYTTEDYTELNKATIICSDGTISPQ